MEPTEEMQEWHCNRIVVAGEIVEINPHGCFVIETPHSAMFRSFTAKMKVPSKIYLRDYWVVNVDGSQVIIPHHVFLSEYSPA